MKMLTGCTRSTHSFYHVSGEHLDWTHAVAKSRDVQQRPIWDDTKETSKAKGCH
jgi:hypothetical protein